MTLGQLALGIFLICAGLAYLGVPIPALLLGITALIAGVCQFVGSVVVVGTRQP